MHCSLLMGDISVAILLWGDFFFRHLFSPNHVFCAKNNFSSHLVTMAIGSANPVLPKMTIREVQNIPFQT